MALGGARVNDIKDIKANQNRQGWAANMSDRWGASNPYAGTPMAFGAAAADRREDRLQRKANRNEIKAARAENMAGMANKLGWEKAENFWGKRAENKGALAANQQGKSDWYETWEPGKAWTDPYKPQGTGRPGKDYPPGKNPDDPNRGTEDDTDPGGELRTEWLDDRRYMPYGEDLNVAKNAFTDLYNQSGKMSTTAGLDTRSGQSFLGGEKYGGYEEAALNRLANAGGGMGSLFGGGVAGDVLTMRQKIAEQNNRAIAEGGMKSGLQEGVERNLAFANQWGATPQSKAAYEARAAQLDLEAQDARDKMDEQFGSENSLWGSRRMDARNKLEQNLTAQKNSFISELMLQDSKMAADYVVRDKELQNSALQIASSIYGQGSQEAMAANNALLQQAQASAQNFLEQTGLKMKENIENWNQKQAASQNLMEFAKWENDFDMQQRTVVNNNSLNVLKTIMPQGLYPEGISLGSLFPTGTGGVKGNVDFWTSLLKGAITSIGAIAG